MATQHYSSGDEIRPGDKVVCADGTTGEVAFIVTSGAHPDFPVSEGFCVNKSDGTFVFFHPSDSSVSLVSSAAKLTRITAPEMIRKAEFLQLLEKLGSHDLYYPAPLARRLAECGFSASVAPDSNGLILEGQLISLTTPDWGKPGISPIDVLQRVYEISTGEFPDSEMTGRGFWFRDVMNKLALFWGLDARHL